MRIARLGAYGGRGQEIDDFGRHLAPFPGSLAGRTGSRSGQDGSIAGGATDATSPPRQHRVHHVTLSIHQTWDHIGGWKRRSHACCCCCCICKQTACRITREFSQNSSQHQSGMARSEDLHASMLSSHRSCRPRPLLQTMRSSPFRLSIVSAGLRPTIQSSSRFCSHHPPL